MSLPTSSKAAVGGGGGGGGGGKVRRPSRLHGHEHASSDHRRAWEIQDVGQLVSTKVKDREALRKPAKVAEQIKEDEHLASRVRMIEWPGFSPTWNALLREITMGEIKGKVRAVRERCEHRYGNSMLPDARTRMLAEMRVALNRDLDVSSIVEKQAKMMERHTDLTEQYLSQGVDFRTLTDLIEALREAEEKRKQQMLASTGTVGRAFSNKQSIMISKRLTQHSISQASLAASGTSSVSDLNSSGGGGSGGGGGGGGNGGNGGNGGGAPPRSIGSPSSTTMATGLQHKGQPTKKKSSSFEKKSSIGPAAGGAKSSSGGRSGSSRNLGKTAGGKLGGKLGSKMGKLKNRWRETFVEGTWRALQKPKKEKVVVKVQTENIFVSLPLRKMPLKDCVANYTMERERAEEEARRQYRSAILDGTEVPLASPTRPPGSPARSPARTAPGGRTPPASSPGGRSLVHAAHAASAAPDRKRPPSAQAAALLVRAASASTTATSPSSRRANTSEGRSRYLTPDPSSSSSSSSSSSAAAASANQDIMSEYPVPTAVTEAAVKQVTPYSSIFVPQCKPLEPDPNRLSLRMYGEFVSLEQWSHSMITSLPRCAEVFMLTFQEGSEGNTTEEGGAKEGGARHDAVRSLFVDTGDYEEHEKLSRLSEPASWDLAGASDPFMIPCLSAAQLHESDFEADTDLESLELKLGRGIRSGGNGSDAAADTKRGGRGQQQQHKKKKPGGSSDGISDDAQPAAATTGRRRRRGSITSIAHAHIEGAMQSSALVKKLRSVLGLGTDRGHASGSGAGAGPASPRRMRSSAFGGQSGSLAPTDLLSGISEVAIAEQRHAILVNWAENGRRLATVMCPVPVPILPEHMRRLLAVWSALGVNATNRITMASKYASPEMAPLLGDALEVWESLCHAVSRRETVRADLKLPGSNAAASSKAASPVRRRRRQSIRSKAFSKTGAASHAHSVAALAELNQLCLAHIIYLWMVYEDTVPFSTGRDGVNSGREQQLYLEKMIDEAEEDPKPRPPDEKVRRSSSVVKPDKDKSAAQPSSRPRRARTSKN